MDVVDCPEPGCGVPAEIIGAFRLPSTDGPCDHVTTSCVRGHILDVRTGTPGPGPAGEAGGRAGRRLVPGWWEGSG